MIKLQLLDACEHCSKFIAKGERIGDIQTGFECESVYHVTCENINACRALLDYLKKEVKKDGR